jgi:hypothetical protein
VAVVVQGPGEQHHAVESFGLELCPHRLSLGIAGRRVSDDELNGDMAWCGLGAVEAQVPAPRTNARPWFAPVLYSCHGRQVASGGRACTTGRGDSMTRQDEARLLLAKLNELAQDETLSEEDAAEMVAGLLGVLDRMRQNPAWLRVMAKADTRSSRWPRWIR